ncbi:MAG: bacteriohemerythrin [Minisyncoccia bacterium]|jgi:hemerythrin-like metal-binding protein
MRFVWTPEYSVGVKEFDDQHKHFFALANKVYEMAMSGSVDKKGLGMAGDEFGNYSLYHLSTEEEYFKKYGYPDASPHIAAHDLYREKIQDYLTRLRREEPDLNQAARELSDFAADWLFRHILSMDRNYKAFFNGKGIQ